MSENEYSRVVELLAESFRSELIEDENESIDEFVAQDDTEVSESSMVNVFDLSKLPYEKMLGLRVSRISLFRDDIWDWRQEGSPLYKDDTYFSWDKNIADGVSLLDRENNHLCHLLKMIAFNSLPQNDCLQNIRSYSTSVTSLKHLLHLGKFLFKYKLFVDIQGNGAFTTAAFLRKEHFISYLEDDLKEAYPKYDFSKQVKLWRGLSKNRLIPVEYRLDFDPFTDEEYKKMSCDMEDNKGTYLPISIETLSELIPYCTDLIEKHSQDIFRIYDVLWPIIAGKRTPEAQNFVWNEAIDALSNIDSAIFDLKMFKIDKYENLTMSMEDECRLKKAISNHPNWNKANPLYRGSLKQLRRFDMLKVASKLGIGLEFFDLSTLYRLIKIKQETERLVSELRNACVVMLFLVTGMRNSEMYLLKVGDCWPVKGAEDDFRIRITVSKTSDASTGKPTVLPIPEIGYKAFKCLETLSEKARIYYKSDKLLLSPTINFGNEIRKLSINLFLGRWCEDLGIEHIHPHQFRKTLAMFAIYQNPNYVGIIKRLFSHKSLAMTLAYIVKMPGMGEEIKLAVIEKNKELLGELLEAINNNCIGGKAGNRIKNVINESKIYKANLHDDGWETLAQYIEVLLQDGLKILHRTSFGAICTNTHSELTHLGPETCDCNVVDCQWAVFTKVSIEDLESDIKFHKNLLEKGCTNEQKQFSNTYIKNCLERLSELKGREFVSRQFPELTNAGA